MILLNTTDYVSMTLLNIMDIHQRVKHHGPACFVQDAFGFKQVVHSQQIKHKVANYLYKGKRPLNIQLDFKHFVVF